MKNNDFLARYNLDTSIRYWFCLTHENYDFWDIGSYNIQDVIKYATNNRHFTTLVIIEQGLYDDIAVLEIPTAEII